MWTPCKTKVERIEKVRSLLMSSDKAVLRGIVAIYRRQTQEEQDLGVTNNKNGIGYSGADAEFMCSLAKQILERGALSAKQIEFGRKKIVKYSRQLAEIAEEREKNL